MIETQKAAPHYVCTTQPLVAEFGTMTVADDGIEASVVSMEDEKYRFEEGGLMDSMGLPKVT